MSRVWPRKGKIEDAAPSFVAAYAGLDGETIVKIRSGYYRARQFALVKKGKNFLETYDESGQQTTAFRGYLAEYADFLSDRGFSKEDASTKARKIEHFGTRHMKALRVTRDFHAVLAVTISSSGPVRIWDRGMPFELS
jgi:hypothetical protein